MWLINLLLLFTLSLDVFFYQGYVSSLLHLPTKILVLISLSLSILFPRNSKSRSSYYLGIFFVVVYVLSLTIEGVNHQGFVYDLIHLRPESMFLFMLPTLFFLASRLFKDKLSLIIIGALIYYFLRLVPIVTVQLTSSTREIVRAPFASYDHKMRLNWGGFYDFTQLVNRVTPDNSLIAIPPRSSSHPLIGNSAFFWYFVYPRTLLSLPLDVASYGQANFVLINGTDPIWPNLSFKSPHIWIYHDGMEVVEFQDVLYDPRDPRFLGGIGIARLGGEQ